MFLEPAFCNQTDRSCQAINKKYFRVKIIVNNFQLVAQSRPTMSVPFQFPDQPGARTVDRGLWVLGSDTLAQLRPDTTQREAPTHRKVSCQDSHFGFLIRVLNSL